ncbi:radical SAM protein [uncultured Fibrobacter sp.]|uniref:radical SAM/SPASM domain-containing protein n=1 Tax=uncultured Fibrobacter sp. TaxID=261512 RepID=UPI0025EA6534|nr:radical SAM protein [uncultured Fibrobacter sp.]
MNLVLSLTERCNLRCTYCYYKVSHEARSLVMTDDVMETAIRLAFERTLKLGQSFLNITFFGGEPLLCMDAIRRGVDFAKNLVRERLDESEFRLRFAVNTNGTLLDDSVVEFLERENFRIYLSLDGHEAHHDVCRKQVGGAGSFKLIEPHIAALRRLDTVVLSVVTRENMGSLSAAVRWIQSQGFRNMTTAVDFDGKWTGEEFDVLAREYAKLAGFWVELKKNKVPFYLGTVQDKLKFRLTGARHRLTSCHVAEGIVACAANGNLFPCTRFISSKKDAPYVMGKVFDDPAQIWNGSVARDILDFFNRDKEDCVGCALRFRCHAHECACTSFYSTGSIHGVSPEVCTHERMLAAICDDAVCDNAFFYKALGEN